VDGLTDVEGRPVLLSDLLAEGGHLVLNRGDTPVLAGDYGTVVPVVGPGQTAPTPTSLVDSGGAFGKVYGVENDGIVVIRPDGYVGAIAHPGTPDTFANYLGRLVGEVRR
jgi:hypothetical protein